MSDRFMAAVTTGDAAFRKGDIETARTELGRAIAMRATGGFVKIIVTDDEQMRILGMRAAGPQVSNTVMSIAHFMDHGKGVRDVLKSIWPHPTISETIRECLRMLLDKSIMKPMAFPEEMVIRRWHPDSGLESGPSICAPIKVGDPADT